jgi:hypothetical protein
MIKKLKLIAIGSVALFIVYGIVLTISISDTLNNKVTGSGLISATATVEQGDTFGDPVAINTIDYTKKPKLTWEITAKKLGFSSLYTLDYSDIPNNESGVIVVDLYPEFDENTRKCISQNCNWYLGGIDANTGSLIWINFPTTTGRVTKVFDNGNKVIDFTQNGYIVIDAKTGSVICNNTEFYSLLGISWNQYNFETVELVIMKEDEIIIGGASDYDKTYIMRGTLDNPTAKYFNTKDIGGSGACDLMIVDNVGKYDDSFAAVMGGCHQTNYFRLSDGAFVGNNYDYTRGLITDSTYTYNDAAYITDNDDGILMAIDPTSSHRLWSFDMKDYAFSYNITNRILAIHNTGFSIKGYRFADCHQQ